MFRHTALVLIVLLSFADCFADTFVNRLTGETFNGYVVNIKRGDKTQVRIGKNRVEYLDLSQFNITRNPLGRKDRVSVFSFTGTIDLICEVEAFEKAIVDAANQGPLFILIEIDTPGGHTDLVQRICTAITQTDNCQTIGFVSGGRFGGAFSEGAIIALACDKVYMKQGTTIGGQSLRTKTSSGSQAAAENYTPLNGAASEQQWRSYVSSIAELRRRPILLVNAMVDEGIEVIEVIDAGQHLLIDRKTRKPAQTLVTTWSEKGSLLQLTADQAVEHGLADKTEASGDQLFAELDAANAKKIPDRNMLAARRGYEQAHRAIDRILSTISGLENDAAALVTQINSLEADISRMGDISTFSRTGRVVGGYYWSANQQRQLRQMQDDHANLSAQLVDVLDTLIGSYQRTITIARPYADLNDVAQLLQSDLDSAQSTFETRSREIGTLRTQPRYRTNIQY